MGRGGAKEADRGGAKEVGRGGTKEVGRGQAKGNQIQFSFQDLEPTQASLTAVRKDGAIDTGPCWGS